MAPIPNFKVAWHFLKKHPQAFWTLGLSGISQRLGGGTRLIRSDLTFPDRRPPKAPLLASGTAFPPISRRPTATLGHETEVRSQCGGQDGNSRVRSALPSCIAAFLTPQHACWKGSEHSGRAAPDVGGGGRKAERAWPGCGWRQSSRSSAHPRATRPLPRAGSTPSLFCYLLVSGFV